MIFSKDTNFVFVHIPRTAGNFITRSLVKELVDHSSFFASLGNSPPVARHATYGEICKFFQLDPSKVNAYAINRPYREIVESDMKLWQTYKVPHRLGPHEQEFIAAAKAGNFNLFKKLRWDNWLGGRGPWEHWCGPNVRPIQYHELEQRWPELCKAAGCKTVPAFRKWDFQKQWYSNNIY